MKEQIPKSNTWGATPFRQNEILGHFARYGVMRLRTLKQLVSDPISMSSLQMTVKRLEASGLVVNTSARIGGSPVGYWMLRPCKSVFKEVSSRTGLDLSQFRSKRCHLCGVI